MLVAAEWGGQGLTPLSPLQGLHKSGQGLTPLSPLQGLHKSGQGLTPLSPLQGLHKSGQGHENLPALHCTSPTAATLAAVTEEYGAQNSLACTCPSPGAARDDAASPSTLSASSSPHAGLVKGGGMDWAADQGQGSGFGLLAPPPLRVSKGGMLQQRQVSREGLGRILEERRLGLSSAKSGLPSEGHSASRPSLLSQPRPGRSHSTYLPDAAGPLRRSMSSQIEAVTAPRGRGRGSMGGAADGGAGIAAMMLRMRAPEPIQHKVRSGLVLGGGGPKVAGPQVGATTHLKVGAHPPTSLTC